jgi:uncharacterized protein (DUF488 family)
MPSIWTVGHGTLDAPDFVALIAGAGIERIVDVRRYPGSRRHPHFASDQMAGWLVESGLEYEWTPALGGRRRPVPDSPNTGLRNAQFQAYADHMATAGFRAAVDDLLTGATGRRVAVMCAESVWWRCHRRLLADHLTLVDGWDVEHLMHDGRLTAHPVTPEAVRDGEVVRYPGPTQLF